MCLHCLGSQRLPRHINNHSCIDVLIKVLLLQTCATYRCDCPNHKTVNASWPGYPALPVGSFVDAYGVRMVGQFLVTRPEDGEPDLPVCRPFNTKVMNAVLMTHPRVQPAEITVCAV